MINKATQFLKEAYSELRQAHWLTRQQAVGSTKVTALLVAVMALYIASVDYAVSIFIRAVLGR
ncbi:MAG: preprotein translocase subunit SecE [Elusimicrobia bacterium]|nr:preprotein translocase subunit SecE [Elusimicrobiota bacterium]